jgi:hypothetical protein
MIDTPSRRAIALPLAALVVAWAIFLFGLYTDLFVKPVYDDTGTLIGQDPAVQASPYVFFVAVAVFAAAAVLGQRIAIRQRIATGPHERLPRGAHRYATLSIVVALAFSAIFAIIVFFSGFNSYGPRSDDLVLRFQTTYLPIILYTALVVTVLLVGFVFRKDSLPKSDDKVATGATEENSHSEPEATKSLGGAYAVPIVAVAIALIFGLMVFDITGTTLEVWVWVLIQLVIGAGIITGTIFGERAVATGPGGTSSRSRITRGARGLNFVLSIVFGAVVTLMGFSYGSGAINSLKIAPSLSIDLYAAPGTPVSSSSLGFGGWDLEEGSEVVLTLNPGSTELARGEVDSFRSHYKDTKLPGSLEPGNYSLVATATTVEGKPFIKTVEFGVANDGTLIWDDRAGENLPYSDPDPRVMTMTIPWLVDDLLPALVLLVLAQLGIFLTLTERNKKRRALTIEG